MTGPISPEFLALQQVLAGRYSIERELGRGGMGIVLLARDVALDRLVAIKLLPRDLSRNSSFRERFLREARTAAGLSHPNIVPIHLVEEHGDLVFFVMSYVDGETLRQRVEHGGILTPRYAMKLMQEVAWALGYAHERGVVHRDIKPDNIMIDRSTDRAMVTDFGIAQLDHDTAEVPTGEIIGTARYMSPEQASGDLVDERSDLYSLAATFFYALTGRAPFEGRSLPAILTKHLTEPPPQLSAFRPEAPGRLAALIGQCLEKSPEDRIQTGDQLAQALDQIRGRDFRAPPLVRNFVRNAEVSTMVLLAVAVGGVSVNQVGNEVVISLGPGIIGTILLVQLVIVARRLLREGYSFDDIRQALLAEAKVQEEEADTIKQRRWFRKLNTVWHRLWAGKVGRWFFRLAGVGIRTPRTPVLPSTDATEMVLGRSVLDIYGSLPPAERTRLSYLPGVVRHLEQHAETLRRVDDPGEHLTLTVAALENIRLALMRLRAGEAALGDMSVEIERAKEIGKQVDRVLEARAEVNELLDGMADPA